jgi:F-type H+-transporting ATPase subunit a
MIKIVRLIKWFINGKEEMKIKIGVLGSVITASPMEQFEIVSFYTGPGLKYLPLHWITNLLIYIVLVVLFILYVYKNAIFSGKEKIEANGWSLGAESLYFTIYNMSWSQIGVDLGLFFFPFLFVLFVYVLFSNLLGLIPYGFTTTAQLATTLAVSSNIWFGVTIIGLVLHHVGFFSFFLPEGTPLLLAPLLALIELVSYIAKGLSLGIRLGANLISGHLLLLILAGFGIRFLFMQGNGFYTLIIRLVGGLGDIGLVTAISGLELGIAGIQSYVYTILTSSYISDSIFLH